MPFPGAAINASQGASCAASSLDEVKRMRSNISLKLLRDLDDRVERIIFQTPFVTAYELNNNEQWVRAEIEGFLYIIQRNGAPCNSFILVNRKSEDHLIEYITPEFQVTLDSNFIFYHSMNMVTKTMNNIRGLWFFDEKECLKSFDVIHAISINRTPLSGFSKKNNSVASGLSTSEKPLVGQDFASNIFHAPAPSPEFDSALTAFVPPKKDDHLRPGIHAPQQMPHFPHHANRSHDLSSDTIDRESSRPEQFNRVTKEVERLISFFQPLTTNENSSHTAKSVHCNPTVDVPHPAASHRHASPKRTPTEATVTVSYDMLCRAFHETIQSDDFVKLMWRRLGELGSRKSD